MIGAVTGFAAGLLLDVALLETLGVSSLVLLSVGYLAGRYRESFEIDSAFAPAAVTGALALLASAGITALQLTLDVDAAVSGAAGRGLDRQGHSRVPPRLSRVSPDPPRSPPGAGPRGGARATEHPHGAGRARGRHAPWVHPRPPQAHGEPSGTPLAHAPGGDASMSFGDGSWNKDRRKPPQLERRVAILGGIALIAFGVILFRLWYLQVLSGDRYLAEAQGNRVREVTVQAPRGEILDRDGDVLVGNRTALALQVRKDELPEDSAERTKVLKARLGGDRHEPREDPQGDRGADEAPARRTR